MRYLTQSLTCWLVMHTLLPALAGERTSPALPLFRVVDLNRGEAAQTTLSDGKKVNVKLLDVDETRDAVRSAVRLARVSVEINGRKVTLDSGNYRLPMNFAGVQIDCPVTKGYYLNCDWRRMRACGFGRQIRLGLSGRSSLIPRANAGSPRKHKSATNPRMSMAEIVRRAKFTIIPGTTPAAAKV